MRSYSYTLQHLKQNKPFFDKMVRCSSANLLILDSVTGVFLESLCIFQKGFFKVPVGNYIFYLLSMAGIHSPDANAMAISAININILAAMRIN